MEATVVKTKHLMHPAIKELLEGYPDVFKEPEGLPPFYRMNQNLRVLGPTDIPTTKKKKLRDWCRKC